MKPLLLVLLASLISTPLMAADDLSAKDQSYRRMAQTLLDGYPDADPMVLDHARSLVAGEKVKAWKNCLLKNALQRAEQTADNQSSLLSK